MPLMPSIQGVIKRRLLVNFRVDPEVVRRILPEGLEPKLHNGYAVAGICLIRLYAIRPAMDPLPLGFSSENAAHRVAVLWRSDGGGWAEGVFIPRRHTNSSVILALGGRLFPGLHKRAWFEVNDTTERISMKVEAVAGDMKVVVQARSSAGLPPGSVFESLEAASAFFRGGALGYSPGREPGSLEGLRLITPDWRVAPLDVSHVYSSWFSDERCFPSGSVDFDCALVMRDVEHQWQRAPALVVPFAQRDGHVLSRHQ